MGDVQFFKGKAIVGFELLKAGFLQVNVVIGVHIVDADDRVALIEQAAAEVKADETGGTGDENFLEFNFHYLTRVLR